jgi:hypothetical protein
MAPVNWRPFVESYLRLLIARDDHDRTPWRLCSADAETHVHRLSFERSHHTRLIGRERDYSRDERHGGQ